MIVVRPARDLVAPADADGPVVTFAREQRLLDAMLGSRQIKALIGSFGVTPEDFRRDGPPDDQVLGGAGPLRQFPS